MLIILLVLHKCSYVACKYKNLPKTCESLIFVADVVRRANKRFINSKGGEIGR